MPYDIGEMVYVCGLSLHWTTEEVHLALTRTGEKKSVHQARKKTISQSTVRHLPSYSLIESVSMTALWVTATPGAWWRVCVVVCCLWTSHVHATTVITEVKCNITWKPPAILVWRCSLGVWWLTNRISCACPLKFNSDGSHHGWLFVRC